MKSDDHKARQREFEHRAKVQTKAETPKVKIGGKYPDIDFFERRDKAMEHVYDMQIYLPVRRRKNAQRPGKKDPNAFETERGIRVNKRGARTNGKIGEKRKMGRVRAVVAFYVLIDRVGKKDVKPWTNNIQLETE